MAIELCREVSDPDNFYFIYPAESRINGYLDINQAVKQDAGQTSVCMIYLTHMIGKARAVAMMVDKKALAEHLAVVKMQDFENKGFEVIVLRYSDLPVMKPTSEHLINVPMVLLALFVLSFTLTTLFKMIGPSIGLNEVKAMFPEDQQWVVESFFDALIGIGIPSFVLMKLMKALRNERARAHELESQQMSLDFQKWEEPPVAQTVKDSRLVAAGKALDTSFRTSQRGPSHPSSKPSSKPSLRHKSSRSRRSHEKAVEEFSRLRGKSVV